MIILKITKTKVMIIGKVKSKVINNSKYDEFVYKKLCINFFLKDKDQDQNREHLDDVEELEEEEHLENHNEPKASRKHKRNDATDPDLIPKTKKITRTAVFTVFPNFEIY